MKDSVTQKQRKKVLQKYVSQNKLKIKATKRWMEEVQIYKEGGSKEYETYIEKTIASILCISMIPSMMTGCKKESTSYSHIQILQMGTVTNITLYGTSDNGTDRTKDHRHGKEPKNNNCHGRLKSSPGFQNQSRIRTNNGKNKSQAGNLKLVTISDQDCQNPIQTQRNTVIQIEH